MPDAAAMAQLVRQPGAAIWERRPGDGDFLTLRIGLGALPSDVRVVEPQPPGDGADEGEQLLPDVPVGVGLGDVGVLGVAGPRAGTLGLARSLVAQVAGLHSPQEVTLVVLSAQDDDAAWAWTSLLPHARPDPREGHWRMGSLARPEQMRKRLGALEAELDARLDVQRRGGRAGGGGRTDGGGRAVTERIVLVVDGAARLRASPEVARLLVDGPAVGIHAICLDSATSRLPAECGAVIELGDGVGATLTGRAGYVPDVVPDLVSEAWAERFARTIAPLRDATPAAGDAALPGRRPPPRPVGRRRHRTGDHGRDLAYVHGRAARRHRGERRRPLRGRPGGTTARTSWLGGTTGAGKSGCRVPGRRAGRGALARGHLVLPAGRLQGRRGLRRLRRAAAHRRPGHRPRPASDRPSAPPCSAQAHAGGKRSYGDVGARDIDDYARLLAMRGRRSRVWCWPVDEFKMLGEELPAFVAGIVRIAAARAVPGRPPGAGHPAARGHRDPRTSQPTGQPPDRPAGRATRSTPRTSSSPVRRPRSAPRTPGRGVRPVRPAAARGASRPPAWPAAPRRATSTAGSRSSSCPSSPIPPLARPSAPCPSSSRRGSSRRGSSGRGPSRPGSRPRSRGRPIGTGRPT